MIPVDNCGFGGWQVWAIAECLDKEKIMKLGVMSALFGGMKLTDALDYCQKVGLGAIELPAGGYPGDPWKLSGIMKDKKKLERLKHKVADGGLDVRSKIATGDEFAELGQAFNDMLGHLQSTQEELRTINRSLDVRLAEVADTNVVLSEPHRLTRRIPSTLAHDCP